MTVSIVRLTQGFHTIIDQADYELVTQFKWCASIESRGTKVYAIRWKKVNGKRTKIRLHRFLMGLRPRPGKYGLIVDHDNDDGLDNCRCNLVKRTQRQNMAKVARWKKKGQKAKA